MDFPKTFSTVAVSLLLAGGCASKKPANTFSGSHGPVQARPAVTPAAPAQPAIPAKDKLVVQYRTALAAMRKGEYPEAKRVLDDAILTMGGIIRDKNARKARSMFNAESKKTFVGEPYERAMAYYYRGILYWMDGQADNARACFRTAQLLDADPDNNNYESDYVLFDYLDGFASAKLADDGSDAFDRAQKISKKQSLPAYNNKANVLCFIDFGAGPLKYATGEHREQLRFRKDNSPIRNVRVKIGEQVHALGPYDDLFFQATTRGGRVMDHILANKAVFKSATSAAGDAALISGAVLAGNRRTQEAALGLVAAGILSKIVSAATTPAADTRAWDNLPQYLSFSALQLPPGQHMLTFEFQDEYGRVLANYIKTVVVNVKAGEDKVVYVSDRSITPQVL